jgi:flagellin
MAINDVALSASMRQNLLSLQGTAELMSRTQNRLSTGKKVNSAVDNPTSFFAAQALDSRANILSGLKDAMGQAISTVEAADKGITAITGLIEQAKGIATQAQAAAAGGANNSQYVEIGDVQAGDQILIGVTVMTATTGGGTMAADEFLIGGNANQTAINLSAAVNANAAIAAANIESTSVVGSKVYLAKTNATDMAAGDIVTPGGQTTMTESDFQPAAGNELATLQSQFNTIRDKLDDLVADSGYKGKNLLASATLSVKFEGTHKLDIVGFDASSTGLGITAAAWAAPADAAADVDKLDDALETLRNESSKLSANLSIVTTRSDFSTQMVNTLTEGSSKLTAADSNEEGANMLALQTRQSLSISSLSLASQANQAVLKLFG